ncbi:G-type lectin S-receptor-like serine/threonine-protein kinase At2g19130 isoform X2 [Neltuma alba]|uniref:G-type lectin S-receptor-like serine/threonine-protein kinase At2g19130 isoform X2 n=1 Tax=Neltuma alba TaxID=207710 RepID=UPI0010A4AE37|nr:G-type lectin S-receptor-like serine/threonine-protein kinase At2g19130 isoform X2 [Prosopis alba]
MTRDMCSLSTQFLVALFLIMLFCRTCKASDGGHQNCSHLCGHLNVSSPFRLNDSPEQCGYLRFNLSCEHNQLVMYWQSGRYSISSIDYENRTIRVRDANIVELDSSSPPEYSLTYYNFSNENEVVTRFRRYDGNMMMMFVKCEHPLHSPGFVDTAPCFNTSKGAAASSSSYSYVHVNVGYGTLGGLGLDDGCGIELIYMTSCPTAQSNQSWSCIDIHNMLLYGFDLYWPYLYWHYLFAERNTILQKILQLIEDIWSYLYAMITFDYLAWRFTLSLPALYTGAKFVLGAPFFLALLIYKWRQRHLSMYESIEDFLQSDNNIIPIRYSYGKIKKMTKGFKVRLGKGGYGSVFKGQLRSGRDVAVKMLDKAKANGQDFINEVATLGRIHHVNVVQLIGYCVQGSKRALVYEFMQNGSLDKYILSKPNDNEQSLNLHQLYAISLGVARGIEYLHKGCDMQILHFDIKPHNILLDGNFIPKVSDFGLAKLYPTNDSIVSLTAARGTIGYMAPELFYQNVGGVSYKADVYSFGMLLMEMAGRRKNLNVLAEQSSQFYFPFWAYDQLNEGNEISIADATEEEMKVARKMLIVGLWCIQTKPSDRPSMNRVVEMLEGEEHDLELPQKPYLYPEELPARDDNANSIRRSNSSSNHPSMEKALEADKQESVLPQQSFLYAQDSPTIDVSAHSRSTPKSSDPSVNNPKETTSFLAKDDERSI